MPSIQDRDPHARVLTRIGRVYDETFYPPLAHANCPENQIRAAVSRVMGKVPHPTTHHLLALKRTIRRLASTIPHCVQAPLDAMPNKYSGAKKRRYLDAMNTIIAFGNDQKNASIKMFVKAERFNPFEKQNPDPRAIQFRDPRYCVELASYLQPIEHYLYITKFGSLTRTRTIAKGLNAVDRASTLMQKLTNFDEPLVLSLDASRFDKHVSLELLQCEHLLYTIVNPDPRLAQLLSWQLYNKCFSDNGMVYKVRGRRMSGDMNTALGNCILMVCMIITAFEMIAVKKYDLLDDGDDIVVIIEKSSYPSVAALPDVFTGFGMTLKVEGAVSNIHEIVFCRSQMIEFEPGKYKFVRNYKDVVSKALCGVRHWANLTYRQRTLHSIGLCELVLNLGIPVLQEFACAILRNVEGDFDIHYAPDGLKARFSRELKLLNIPLEYVKPVRITDSARVSFASAFNLSIPEQLALEQRFRTWSFRVGGALNIGDERLHYDWTDRSTSVDVYHH